jgi:hypothetical protein
MFSDWDLPVCFRVLFLSFFYYLPRVTPRIIIFTCWRNPFFCIGLVIGFNCFKCCHLFSWVSLKYPAVLFYYIHVQILKLTRLLIGWLTLMTTNLSCCKFYIPEIIIKSRQVSHADKKHSFLPIQNESTQVRVLFNSEYYMLFNLNKTYVIPNLIID